MSLRILGGSAKGRSLEVPDSARPSGARIRKSLFDLPHHIAERDIEQWTGLIGWLEA
jgi:16S rRNA G966 N2-methylase RsmD